MRWEGEQAAECPRDELSMDRVQRTSSTFLQALKDNSQMEVLFEEYFGGEASFREVVEKRDFRYLFIQLMKMVTEYSSISRNPRG